MCHLLGKVAPSRLYGGDSMRFLPDGLHLREESSDKLFYKEHDSGSSLCNHFLQDGDGKVWIRVSKPRIYTLG